MRFWPFASRGARVSAMDLSTLPPIIDFALFAINDVAIKLWLPIRLVTALDTISADTEASRPDILRRLFFEHVYGRVLFEQLVVWQKQQEQTPPPPAVPPMIRCSPSRASSIEYLGKSTEDYKLWLPLPLKTELESLAKKDGLGLSDYLRKILVRLLLGETAYAQWRTVIGEVLED